ncbi:MAG: FAD-dependent oxidoreductase [bacterium]|nr:FAD-dependent oxidoreductase [bacterium]
MRYYDVIIIGGGPSGVITGVTGLKQYPGKTFLLLKEEEKGLVPCGIPYIFHDLGDIDKNAMSPKPFIAAGGEVVIDSVTEVNLDTKTLDTANGSLFSYDKLVFATGSTPIVPSFIKGHQLEGVEYIKKSYQYMERLKEKTDTATDIVVIGGGFIGAEVAEQLAKFRKKNVSLVEMEKACLYRAFSEDVATKATDLLEKSGVHLYTDSKVEEICGLNGQVESVTISDGTRIKADIVISAVGYTPNTTLAGNAGLEINSMGAIRVDRYLRTGVKDVYAVGDCAQTEGFITGRTDNIMLASVATAEARILGYNLYDINLLRDFAGTLPVFSTEINGTVFASAGAIEQTAEEANVDFVMGSFQDTDRHPPTFDDTSVLMVKLTVSPKTGTIIGGEIHGGKSVGEMINIISLAIQKGVTVYELISFQIGTHPLLTTAPTKYVLIKAAENAVANISKKYKENN